MNDPIFPKLKKKRKTIHVAAEVTNYHITKSEAAYRMTVDRLYDDYPKLYFWTFTFVNCLCDWQYAQTWNRFWREVEHRWGQKIHGVKVLEFHPEGHGIHYHCIVTMRLPVNLLRKIGHRYGMGRMHVRVARQGDKFYLAKYLTKDNHSLKGHRRWHTMGGYDGCRKNNVVLESPFTRALHRVTGGQKISFSFYKWALKQFECHGEIQGKKKVKYLSCGTALHSVTFTYERKIRTPAGLRSVSVTEEVFDSVRESRSGGESGQETEWQNQPRMEN